MRIRAFFGEYDAIAPRAYNRSACDPSNGRQISCVSELLIATLGAGSVVQALSLVPVLPLPRGPAASGRTGGVVPPSVFVLIVPL